jgi:hypothetical protein
MKRVVEVFYELKDLFTGQVKKITGSYKDLRRESGKTSDKIERDNKRASGSFSKLGKTVGNLRNAYFALSGIVAGAGILRGVRSVSAELDRLAKTSSQLDITAQQLSNIEFAFERSGVAASKASAAIFTLQKRTGEAAQGFGQAARQFEALGINVEEFIKLDAEQQMILLADALQNVATEEERAAIAAGLFSKGNAEVIKGLKDGGAAFAGLLRQGESYRKITEEQTKAAEEFEDALTNLNAKLDGLKVSFGGPVVKELNEFLNNIGAGDKLKGLEAEIIRLEDLADKGILRRLFGFDSRGEVLNRLSAARFELSQLRKEQEEADRQGQKRASDLKTQAAANAEYTGSIKELTDAFKEQSKEAETALKKETSELEAARKKQLSIEQEFANLRKSITAPEGEDVTGLDVQLKILEAKTKLQNGEIQGAIDASRDAGGLLESLKEGGDEAGFVLSFLAKEIERVANSAAQQNVDLELIDKKKAEEAAGTLKAQLESLKTEAPKLGAEAGKAYIDAFQAALNATPATLPAVQAPSLPTRRPGTNTFSDGTDFRDAVELEGGK